MQDDFGNSTIQNLHKKNQKCFLLQNLFSFEEVEKVALLVEVRLVQSDFYKDELEKIDSLKNQNGLKTILITTGPDSKGVEPVPSRFDKTITFLEKIQRALMAFAGIVGAAYINYCLYR